VFFCFVESGKEEKVGLYNIIYILVAVIVIIVLIYLLMDLL
jgi:heme/copper-type cytochrome/quinol oxidase subunit 4